MKNKYDVAIIGGGPAAVSAGIYAARKKLKTLLIAKEWGGQIGLTSYLLCGCRPYPLSYTDMPLGSQFGLLLRWNQDKFRCNYELDKELDKIKR